MNTYEVIVGNVGMVYTSHNKANANRCFCRYKAMSKANYGRCAGESVCMFKNGEIEREYIGSIDQADDDI